MAFLSESSSITSWTDSDFVVFGFPLVLGFAVSVCILFFSFPPMSASKRMTVIFGLSAIGAVVSSYVGTVIAFNLYGT